MNSSARPLRRTAALAAALALAAGTAGCSGDEEKKAAPSSATASSTVTTSPTSAVPSPTSTTATTSATSSTSAPTTASSTASTPTTVTPTTPATSVPPFNTALAASCVSAVQKMNAMVRQWNSATRSGTDRDLRAASATMGRTATDLRGLADSSKDDGYTRRAREVASRLDVIRTDIRQGDSVKAGAYNRAASELRGYCSNQLGGAQD